MPSSWGTNTFERGAPIALVGYIAAKESRQRVYDSSHDETPSVQSSSGFLAAPLPSAGARRLFDDDLNGVGYVMNVSRLWAHLPEALGGLSDLMGEATEAGFLTSAQRSVLVTAAASELGDSYCSLAWGKKLAEAVNPDVAASVIRGGDEGLDGDGQALARWARLVARDPNAVTADDVQALRDAGFDDAQIFAITLFVALRLAFSSVNDALGATPDRELALSTPEEVRAAVAFGRPFDTEDE
jgi:alkylhydroperoxidase family enzyme